VPAAFANSANSSAPIDSANSTKSSSPDPDALRTLRKVSIRRLTSRSYDRKYRLPLSPSVPVSNANRTGASASSASAIFWRL
jgi:hypothetical protein